MSNLILPVNGSVLDTAEPLFTIASLELTDRSPVKFNFIMIEKRFSDFMTAKQYCDSQNVSASIKQLLVPIKMEIIGTGTVFTFFYNGFQFKA